MNENVGRVQKTKCLKKAVPIRSVKKDVKSKDGRWMTQSRTSRNCDQHISSPTSADASVINIDTRKASQHTDGAFKNN